MKLLSVPSLLLVAAVTATAAGDSPRVTRPMLIETEKILDTRISASIPDNPFMMLGLTRGVYLEGYGAVFTAEVNLVAIPAGVQMFRPVSTPSDVAQHRKKKLERVPMLRTALRQALLAAANSLAALPADDQIVFVALLAKYPWEDVSGIPQQIRVQASKKQLLDLRNNPAGLEAAIAVADQ